jgi:hypothetical protein
MMYRQVLPLLLLLLPTLGACAAGNADGCKAGADCPSGVCNVDGTCGDAATTASGTGTGMGTGSGGSGGAGGSAMASSGTGGGATSSTGSGGGAGACSPPNNDGVITQEEVPLGPGLHAKLSVATSVPVNTVGTVQPDGSHVWDLSAAIAGQKDEQVETLPITGQWFAATYPGATYASKLSSTADLLGVFEVTTGALLLRGVVSPADGAMATKLVYATPIEVLSFPIKAGKTWTTTSAVTGKAQGITIGGIYNETYDSKVDAHGTMKTPFATFPVLRIRVGRVSFLNGLYTKSHRFVFAAECFSTVATMVSENNETVDEFTTAAEVSRLAL